MYPSSVALLICLGASVSPLSMGLELAEGRTDGIHALEMRLDRC